MNQPSKSTRTAGYLLDALAQAGLGFWIIVTASRSLTIEQFGALAFILALAGLQQPIATLGTQQIVYGKVALKSRRPTPFTWQATIITLLAAITIYTSTTLALIASTGLDYTALYLVAGIRVFGAISLPLVSDAQARHAIKEYLPIRLLTTLTAATAAFVAMTHMMEAQTFAAIWALESLTFTILMLFAAIHRKRLKKPIYSHSRSKLTLKALPIAAQSILISIYYRFDQIYVQLRFGPEEMAVYASAAKLAEAGNIAAGVAIMAIGPSFIKRIYTEPDIGRALTLGFIGISTVALLASIASMVIGGAILSLIFGNAFAAGSKVLSVYVLSTAFVAVGGLCSRALIARGDTKAQIVSGLAGMVTIVLTCVVLCEFIGPIGAAWATVLSYAASASVLAFRLSTLRRKFCK